MKGRGEEEALFYFPSNLLFIPLFPSRFSFTTKRAWKRFLDRPEQTHLSVFQIPRPRILDSTTKNFLHSGIRIPWHGEIFLTPRQNVYACASLSISGLFFSHTFQSDQSLPRALGFILCAACGSSVVLLRELSNEVIFSAPIFVCFALFAFKLDAIAMLCLRNWFIY